MRKDKILQLIKNIKSKDKQNGYYTGVIDKYTNGECETFVGYCLQLNDFKGEVVDIYLIPKDEYDENLWDYEERIFHSVYYNNEYYYDINGRTKDIQKLIEKLPYYEKENHKIEISKYKAQKDNNFYPELRKEFMENIKTTGETKVKKLK